MNEFDFGKHLREQLNEHPSPVNSDTLWHAVEARLPHKRKRRGFLFFLGALLGSLLLLAIFSWVREEQQEVQDSSNTFVREVALFRELPVPTDSCREFTEITTPATLPAGTTTQATTHLHSVTIPEKPGQAAEKLPSLPTTSFHESPNALWELPQQSGASDISLIDRLEPLPVLLSPLSAPRWKLPPLELEAASDATSEKLAPVPTSGFFLRQDLGMGLVKRQLQSHLSASEPYALARNRTEQPLESVHGQLLLGYQFPSGYYLLSGISITGINERFHLERNREEIETVPVLVEVFVNQNGDSLFTYGSANLLHVHHEQYTHYNRYTMYEIPFIAGYTWQYRRWSLGLEAGAMLNVSLRTRGSMLSEEDLVVRLQESNLFKSRVNWSYLGQARVGYALSERLEWSLAPGVQIRPGSLLESSQLEQTYKLLYLHTGLTYRFRKR